MKTYDYKDVLKEKLHAPQCRHAYDEVETEFNDISKGLNEAIAFANGETTAAVVHMHPTQNGPTRHV